MKPGNLQKKKALSHIEKYWTVTFTLFRSFMFKKVNVPNKGCRVTSVLKVTDRLTNKINSYPGRPRERIRQT